MVSRFAVFGSALALLAAAAAAPVAAGPARSLQLSKVILDAGGDTVKGRLKVGTICLFGGGPLRLADRKITQDHERFEGLFSRTMKERGYAVVATDADLFAGEGTTPKGDLLVGATLRLDEVNLCSSVNGEKGAVTVTVEWKVFDRAARKVVSTVATTGQGRQEKFARDGLSRMIDGAFVDSLRLAVDRPEMRTAVGAPALAPASAPTAPA